MSAWRFLKLQTKWGSAFKSICQWCFAWVAQNYQSLCLPEAGMFVCRSERGPAALPAPPGLSGPQLCTRTTQLLARVTFLAVLPLPVHENLSWVRLFLLGGFLAAVVSQLWCIVPLLSETEQLHAAWWCPILPICRNVTKWVVSSAHWSSSWLAGLWSRLSLLCNIITIANAAGYQQPVFCVWLGLLSAVTAARGLSKSGHLGAAGEGCHNDCPTEQRCAVVRWARGFMSCTDPYHWAHEGFSMAAPSIISTGGKATGKAFWCKW